ncbi:glycine/D-amino acid oxidase-like deaminating enzyme [Pseudomonas duriflava]|uniref:Glycine/D-amino acid oxidase-like deaminating enzyme n=1 Tax=Pseudomonas duriflava TaxID=459528 RepID=A0A562Q8K2_9PSED|nr:FAD-binding oxidoreductase [Pseudomonas duriflava]TWI52356.1 glycine/D-amino acid oxidase-like deaminating enzyme [Pseudomonas duriflava]
MPLRQHCLWEALSPNTLNALPLKGELNADICIIGAGITGLSAALHLAEQGKRVVIVEAHEVGHGGSGRNVGLVNAGMWIPPDTAVSTLGAEVGEKLLKVMGNAPYEVFSLIERYGIECQAQHKGTLHMAHNAKGLADLRSRAEQWQRRGAPVELLSGASCVEACGTTHVSGALLDRRAGTINPMAYSLGLARAAVRLGVQLYERSAVLCLERQSAKWCVVTAQGTVLAEQVIMASNAYTEGEWTTLRNHFFPGYYYQVASTPLGEEADFILPGGQGSWDTRTVLSSIRRDADGRLLLGSLGNMSNRPAWFIEAWADRIQRYYFPRLGKIEWEYTWTGCIAFTPDHLMRLFEPAPGLLAMTGYNGRGVTTGTVVGKAFAHYLCRGSDEVLPMPFTRFEQQGVGQWRSPLYEAGFSLYHAGQCLRIVV